MLKIGIIGAGQLARMLCEAGNALGHEMHVLGLAGDPAQEVCAHYHEGQIDKTESLLPFCEAVDLLTIESEFVDTEAISQAQRECSHRVPCYPLPQSIKISQDKLSQKELFNRLHLPTARHRALPGKDLELELGELFEDFPNGFILKWSKFGYDGKGNFVLRSDDSSTLTAAVTFCQKAFQRGVRVYAEELVDFSQEMAMVFVRTRGGESDHYPLVYSFQEKNICKWVEGPAVRLGAKSSLESEAFGIGRALGDGLQMIGVFAVEFFLTRAGGVLVNEMAPRVHNSGHFTLGGAETSQFATHIRAIAGDRLAPLSTAPFFGMLNLIGPSSGASRPDAHEILKKSSGKFLPYWYGKKEVREGRKMGHINVVASSVTELAMAKQQLLEKEASIWSQVILG